MIDVAAISALVANGFTVTLLPDGSMKVEGATDTRSSNAKRCARYRMSKPCQNVSESVESMSQHNTPAPSLSPAPSPSPLSPTPPIPAPAPTPPYAPPPTRTRVRQAKVSAALPSELAEEYRVPLQAWLDYKAERGHAYTERGMKVLVKRAEEYSPIHVSVAVENAILGNWQGINLTLVKPEEIERAQAKQQAESIPASVEPSPEDDPDYLINTLRASMAAKRQAEREAAGQEPQEGEQ